MGGQLPTKRGGGTAACSSSPRSAAMADLFLDFVIDFFRFGNDLWIVVDFVDGG